MVGNVEYATCATPCYFSGSSSRFFSQLREGVFAVGVWQAAKSLLRSFRVIALQRGVLLRGAAAAGGVNSCGVSKRSLREKNHAQ